MLEMFGLVLSYLNWNSVYRC